MKKMKIQELNREVRQKALKKIDKRPAKDLVALWSTEDLLYSGVGRAIFIVLPTSGCSWALNETGGCTMCSYIADSPLSDVSADEIIKIFNEKFHNQEISSPTVVKIFVSGSFLNPEEVPQKARREILTTLNSCPEIEEIIVESRPQYINEAIIRDCCGLIPDKTFEVAIGLETWDENRRINIINKGFNNREFEKGITIINNLKKEYKVSSKVYLLVKPILTNEKDAVGDAIQSAIYAEKIGVDRISFCPATIHKGTLMELLWRKGSYQPAWIWSIMEIIKKVRNQVKIPVIMDTAGFGTRRGPYNCKKCNSKLKEVIIESNLTQTIPEDFECECKKKWQADLEFSDVNRSNTFLNG